MSLGESGFGLTPGGLRTEELPDGSAAEGPQNRPSPPGRPWAQQGRGRV